MRTNVLPRLVFCIVMIGISHVTVNAEQVSEGEKIYQLHCASCHSEAGPAKAPYKMFFHFYSPETILQALNEGSMRDQGAGLSAKQRQVVAEHLAGRPMTDITGALTSAQCKKDNQTIRVNSNPVVRGWGFNLSNTRFHSDTRNTIHKDNISKLKLKWAFAYPGAVSTRTQPTIHGNTLFTADQNGRVYALDRITGCIRWIYKARVEVRTALSLGKIKKTKGETIPVVFFGDVLANVYALDARDGSLLWQDLSSNEQKATITGSLTFHNDRLYVPVSSHEGLAAIEMTYPCCTFRGSVVAYNAIDGKKIWTSYTVEEEPGITGHNSVGTAKWGPSGVAVWNRPTIDTKRNRLYVGTAENYTSPATRTSDAVIAMDLDTGHIDWVFQALANDAWNAACFMGPKENCPKENGPDLDIGAATILVNTTDDKQIILAAQKSGDVFALDPDNEGALIWHKIVGKGSSSGGIHWGIAADNNFVYVPISDKNPQGYHSMPHKPGLHALELKTGQLHWYTPAVDVCKKQAGCFPGLSAPATVTADVVFAGALDGHIRAYDKTNGKVIWDFNTAKEFTTVNGVTARGGSIDAVGTVIADGIVYVSSGYALWSQMPGNVLLAFSIDGK